LHRWTEEELGVLLERRGARLARMRAVEPSAPSTDKTPSYVSNEDFFTGKMNQGLPKLKRIQVVN
jgi:hypothetical protein